MLETCTCAGKVWMNNKLIEHPPISLILFCPVIGLFFLHGSVPLAISEGKGKDTTPYYYILYYFYEHVFVQYQSRSLKAASAAVMVTANSY